MSQLHETIQRYLDRVKGQVGMLPVREISVEALTKMERSLDWKTHVVSSQEFEDAKFLFNRVDRPAHSPNHDELEQLAEIFDEPSVQELSKSLTKSVNGTCKCGRDLTIFDVIVKALNNSAHSVAFMKDVMGGDRGHFLICGTDGSEDVRDILPEGTIWVENTQPTECVNCGEAHQLLVVMTYMAHNWVLRVPDEPDERGNPDEERERPSPDNEPSDEHGISSMHLATN